VREQIGRAILVADTIHVLGIAGSLRRGSVNKGLLRVAAELVPDGMTIETYDLSEIPLYNGDVQAEGDPEAVRHLKERIAAADALLIATPEYNYSIPGVLKNAIDWVSRPPETSPLIEKPIALMGAGGLYGTVRSQLHLRQVFVFTNSLVMPKPELMVQRSWEKFDKDGNLLDAEIRERVGVVLQGLAAWTLRLKK
jgi:chromate reductase